MNTAKSIESFGLWNEYQQDLYSGESAPIPNANPAEITMETLKRALAIRRALADFYLYASSVAPSLENIDPAKAQGLGRVISDMTEVMKNFETTMEDFEVLKE